MQRALKQVYYTGIGASAVAGFAFGVEDGYGQAAYEIDVARRIGRKDIARDYMVLTAMTGVGAACGVLVGAAFGLAWPLGATAYAYNLATERKK